MPALAGAGWRGGRAATSPASATRSPTRPARWEHHVESIERFRPSSASSAACSCVHDWGGLIGLRWACEHPDAVRALAISGSGFFPEGKWHGMARRCATPETGEQYVDAVNRDALRRAAARRERAGIGDEAIDEYWKAFGGETRRRAPPRAVPLRRLREAGRLPTSPTLDVPVLLIWGESDQFAPLSGAHRFERELADTRLVVVEGAGHFVWEEAPERCAEALASVVSS